MVHACTGAGSPSAASGGPDRYDALTITLHWLLAVLITLTFGLGWYMTDLSVSPLRLKIYNWHKWAGMTVLALWVLRILWRRGHPPPPLPEALAAVMGPWRLALFHIVHRAMVVLLVLVPVAGWAYSAAAGFPVAWLGVLLLPDPVPVNPELARVVYQPLHAGSAWFLGALVMLHVGAVLKHRWIDRADVLARMWPVWSRDPK